jgi:hypothetical protein
MSKLSDYLKKQKIDSRRLLNVSKKLERLTPEDRAIRLAQKRVRAGTASDAEKELAANKGHSGKAVTRPTLDRAMKGEEISAAAMVRVLRAVNHLLVQKKKSEAQVGDLF